MLALSGFAEWFWLMCMNIKPVENRTWSLPGNIRNKLPLRIYLHASQRKAPQDHIDFILSLLTSTELDMFNNVNFETLRGRIIGEVTITRCIKKYPDASITLFEIVNREDCPEYYSPWFFSKYGFVVKDGILYPSHLQRRCKGYLGFFTPDIQPVRG